MKTAGVGAETMREFLISFFLGLGIFRRGVLVRVAFDRVGESDDQSLFARTKTFPELLGLEIGELFGERDAWQVRDLPSVADACERDAESHVSD